jgi:hypothetical protein
MELEGFSGIVDYAFPAADASTVSALSAGSGLTRDGTASLIRNINTAETNNFLQTLNGADGASNNSLTYAVMLSRNRTIADIATDMTAQNLQSTNGSKDTYSRQAEINEWQAQNKLDTLFFLQLTFLFFTLMVVLLFLRQYGMMTNGMLWIIASLFLVLLIGTLWNRASYTMNSRDQRYWNRRFLGLSDSGLAAKAATCQ